ncbi:MAG: DinB family protein [Pelobium sp.]
MSVLANKKKILTSLNFYEDFLKTINEEEFSLTPPSGGWSYSEVYSHILGSNIMSFISIEKCLNKTVAVKTHKEDWKVRLIMFLGRFPPGKITAPTAIAALVKKITKEEASNLLIKIRKRIAEINPNFKNFDPNYKMKHPRMGYINAKYWLRFILIHTKHHEKQLLRIAKDFKNH